MLPPSSSEAALALFHCCVPVTLKAFFPPHTNCAQSELRGQYLQEVIDGLAVARVEEEEGFGWGMIRRLLLEGGIITG